MNGPVLFSLAFGVVAVVGLLVLLFWTWISACRLCFPHTPIPLIDSDPEPKAVNSFTGAFEQKEQQAPRQVYAHGGPEATVYVYSADLGSSNVPAYWLQDLRQRRN